MSTTRAKLGAAPSKPAFSSFKKKDGLYGIWRRTDAGRQCGVVKAHGSSNANAIMNAIRQARSFAKPRSWSRSEKSWRRPYEADGFGCHGPLQGGARVLPIWYHMREQTSCWTWGTVLCQFSGSSFHFRYRRNLSVPFALRPYVGHTDSEIC